ncbi:6-hydroxytryprostatin B O-methyltransferase [Cyphellophora attinorum]|uniref:6-hydroxytryprostatin B O-methyltransferase n=1 Tax=Cyphellophora attinorum TaxID=1664694 RepID=A0A0N0NJN7_9EURO|nr:6-hydroxytryprostatin B O-methyltransferase [Phialophora attinorum]KPI36869.1 6-hydroxytryprostatin B O-methyltransferase [Phialophora attinorum]
MLTNQDFYGSEEPMSLSSIEVLAQKAADAARQLARFHRARQPETTRAATAGFLSLPDGAPAEITAAKTTLLEATTALQQLVMSPSDFHLNNTIYTQQLASYRWLANLQIADHVPLDGSIEYNALAEIANVPVQQLTRIARLAMTGGFFYEPTPGHIQHTAISAGFRSSEALGQTMLFLTETVLPTTTKIVEMSRSAQYALREGTEAPARTAFQLAHNTSLPFFAYLAQAPELGKRLAAGMRNNTAAQETSVQHVLNGFDWSALPAGTHVVDLGGNHGLVSVYLAERLPNLRFTVQDLEGVIVRAPAIPMELEDRVKFQAHSFFEPQPEGQQADVFFIRQCLNNWPDEDVVRILQALVPSLEGSGKTLLMNNIVVPAPFSTIAVGEGDVGPASVDYYGKGLRHEATARTRDVSMMQMMNGAERDMQQWTQLLKAADERLEIVAVQKPEGSILSVIEVKLRSTQM